MRKDIQTENRADIRAENRGEIRPETQADRAYALMFATARQWLQEKKPEDIAAAGGAVWDAGISALRLPMLGEELCIDWPSCEIRPRPENWQALVLLHYLNLADGMPASGERFSFRDMKDGMVRGGKFEFTADRTLSRILKDRSRGQILDACRKLGGTETTGKGDISVQLPFLPHLPVYLSVWLPDEEFPVSGHLYPDRNIDHCLTIEDAVTAGEIILRRLEQALTLPVPGAG